MSKALLFFDADGTLIGETNRILPESTVRAVRKARENGHLAFLNTGRPFRQSDPDVMAIGFDGYLCACGLYIQIGGKVVLDVRQDPEYCRALRDDGIKDGLEMIFESYDAWFYDAERSGGRWSREEMELIKKTGSRTFDSLYVPEFRFEKFLIWKNEADPAPFLQKYGKDFRAIDRGIFFECVPQGYTKATAIDRTVEYLHMEDAETYAFGDSTNDADMLDRVDHPVLMGNAPEQMRCERYYLTDRIENDGIANALRHFGLI